ncbi:MAG: hypothetical protein HZB55_13410 [Deltaproteobacteria bacterium]|nr:hypothetical protein [Deltaproteobacteria bacterium]
MERLVSMARRAGSFGKILGALLAASAFLASAARAELWMGNMSVLLGEKRMDKDSWEPAANGPEVGVILDFRPESSRLSAAIDLLQEKTGGAEKGFDLDVKTHELHLGARKLWNDGEDLAVFRPYVGAGLSLARAEATLQRTRQGSSIETGYGIGGWVGAGLYCTPIPWLNLGVDVRWSMVPVKLAGERFDAGGLHYGVSAGWRWMGPI